MAYQFSNQMKANAIIKQAMTNNYKIAGVNGEQTDANNFNTAIMGLLHVVGKDADAAGLARAITQDVEDAP